MSVCPTCNQALPAPCVLPTAKRWSFDVPRKVPSLNAHVSNFGGARWNYRKVRLAWKLDIENSMLVFGVSKATLARRIVLTRIYVGRERLWDFDNLVGGMKPVLDAMKLAGLIVDDNHVWLTCEYKQSKEGGTSGLRVEVFE